MRRFKTKEELESEYRYADSVPGGWCREMDALFGKPYDGPTGRSGTPYGISCYISEQMLTDKPLSGTPLPFAIYEGRYFTATIRNTPNIEGRISIGLEGDVHLCQNVESGANKKLSYGYKYSYDIGIIFRELLTGGDYGGVRNLRLLDTPSRMEEIKNYHGRAFQASINGHTCDGKIHVTRDNRVFLCQNAYDGCTSHPRDFGYIYSYQVTDVLKSIIENGYGNSVRGFRFVSELELKVQKPMETSGIAQYEGRGFQAIIETGIKTSVVEGKIMIRDGRAYLCQDERDGGNPTAYGYKYSWSTTELEKLIAGEDTYDIKSFSLKGAPIPEYSDDEEESEDEDEDWDEDDLLSDARDSYSEGDKVYCAINGHIITVTDSDDFYVDGDGDICNGDEGYLYYRSKDHWATQVKSIDTSLGETSPYNFKTGDAVWCSNLSGLPATEAFELADRKIIVDHILSGYLYSPSIEGGYLVSRFKPWSEHPSEKPYSEQKSYIPLSGSIIGMHHSVVDTSKDPIRGSRELANSINPIRGSYFISDEPIAQKGGKPLGCNPYPDYHPAVSVVDMMKPFQDHMAIHSLLVRYKPVSQAVKPKPIKLLTTFLIKL